MRSKLLIVVSILFSLVLGYALLTRELTINGNANISSNNWDVHFANISNQKGVIPSVEPSIIDNTSVSYSVNFTKLGDYYSFTLDVVNSGTLDAMIDILSNTLTEIDGKSYSSNIFTFDVTYNDDIEIEKYHLLKAGTTEKIRVYAKLNDEIEISDLPSENLLLMGNLTMNFVLADENAKERDYNTFAKISWERLKYYVQNNDLSLFSLGETKCVALNGFSTTNNNGCPSGEFAIRIANMSSPAECNSEGFAQTYCGFVLEFVDIITNYPMNSTSTNEGGYSLMPLRTYLNTTIFDALPADLKEVIAETPVISGVQSASPSVVMDKLYLPSQAEAWGSIGNDDGTDSSKYHRSDYYTTFATSSNWTVRTKEFNNVSSKWWTRSFSGGQMFGGKTTSFVAVYPNGGWLTDPANSSLGVSPSFKIN